MSNWTVVTSRDNHLDISTDEGFHLVFSINTEDPLRAKIDISSCIMDGEEILKDDDPRLKIEPFSTAKSQKEDKEVTLRYGPISSRRYAGQLNNPSDDFLMTVKFLCQKFDFGRGIEIRLLGLHNRICTGADETRKLNFIDFYAFKSEAFSGLMSFREYILKQRAFLKKGFVDAENCYKEIDDFVLGRIELMMGNCPSERQRFQLTVALSHAFLSGYRDRTAIRKACKYALSTRSSAENILLHDELGPYARCPITSRAEEDSRFQENVRDFSLASTLLRKLLDVPPSDSEEPSPSRKQIRSAITLRDRIKTLRGMAKTDCPVSYQEFER